MPQGSLLHLEEWKQLQGEYQQLQETHRLYLQKLEEISQLQDKCSSSISVQRKRLKDVHQLLKRCDTGSSAEDAKSLDQITGKIKTQPNALGEMETFLPKNNGLYLRLILGNVNVTLLSKQSKLAYKDEYEKFKLCLTVLLLLLSFLCFFFATYRFLDAILNFLLVWFYCTLTVRESILISNGSRIKGWWVFHHYISAFLSGVMLTWPDGSQYKSFRSQFLAYSLYQSFVQCLQCYYQSGCLYRLRSLGERHNLDLTVAGGSLTWTESAEANCSQIQVSDKVWLENANAGFQSWMWKGLTFLLPFIFFGHFWQLFNSLSLFRMAQDPDRKEWQVLMCAFCFLVLFVGNFFTTVAVVHQKLKNGNQRLKRL